MDDLSIYDGQADLPVTGERYYYRLPDEEEWHYVEHHFAPTDDGVTYLPDKEHWRIAEWTESPRRRLRYLLQSALHLVARLVAGAWSLARDACESVYASYPSEAEDGFERALAESRLEEQEPWTVGQ